MSRAYRISGALILFLSIALCSQAQSAEAKSLLDKVEQKRRPWTKMRLSVRLKPSRDAGKTSRYDVYIDRDRTLVAFEEPAEQKGTLLLLSQGDLWLYLRGVSQPMKVTPLQRLGGAVSYVDLVNMGWRDAYTITKEQPQPDNRLLLTLAAKAKENSFQSIELLVDRKTARPVRANIYLASGKLFKALAFSQFQTVAGKEVATGILFTDYFDNGVQTTADYFDIKKDFGAPESYFNKDSLVATSRKILAGK